MNKELQTIREALDYALGVAAMHYHDDIDMIKKAIATFDTLAKMIKMEEDACKSANITFITHHGELLTTTKDMAPEQCLACGRQCPNECPMDKAAEPSEDALVLIYDIATLPAEGFSDKAAALIEADRQRVREECADIAVSFIFSNEICRNSDELRAAIMGSK